MIQGLKTAMAWAKEYYPDRDEDTLRLHFLHQEIEFSNDGNLWWIPLDIAEYQKPAQVRIKEGKKHRPPIEWLQEKGYPRDKALLLMRAGRVWFSFDKTKTTYFQVTDKDMKVFYACPTHIRVDGEEKKKYSRMTGLEWVEWKKAFTQAEAEEAFKFDRVLFNDGAATFTPEAKVLYNEPVDVIILAPKTQTAFRWVMEMKELSSREVEDLFNNGKILFDNGNEVAFRPIKEFLCQRPFDIIIDGTPESDEREAEIWVVDAGFAHTIMQASAQIRLDKIRFDFGNRRTILPVIGTTYRRPKAIWLEDL